MKKDRLYRLARFFISGGLATGTNLFVLYFLTERIGMWYLIASVIAFLTGFVVSFTLQKFWTFKNMRLDAIGQQLVRYMMVILVNLVLNTVLVYLLVEYAGLHPLFAQGTAALIIAFEGYFAYKYLVFTPKPPLAPNLSQEQ